MKSTFLSTLILASCATVLASPYSINVNFPRCYSAMVGADADSNKEINMTEFLPFLVLYGPPGCFQESSLSLEQISVFDSLACLCQLHTNDKQCCYKNRAYLNVTGDNSADPTSSELNNLQTICTVAAKTIHAQCPNLFLNASSPGGPTSATSAPISGAGQPTPSFSPQSPSTGGNGNGSSNAPLKPSLRPVHSHAPVRSPAPQKNNSTGPTLAPSVFFNSSNFTNATNFTTSNATALHSDSGNGGIPWWVWLLLALLLLLLLLCCLILICCCCRRRDEKEEEGLVTENVDGASGENDDDDGNVKYRDGVPGEDDEVNNRLKRGTGELPDNDGFDNEGVNLNHVGDRGNRGNGNGDGGQTFDPYDSSGNYRRGENGDGNGDGYKYTGDWDRLNRGGEGDDGDNYKHYPGGKRLPGEDGENTYGVSLRPTETRSGQAKKDNDDDFNYPGTMDGYNPYDGGAHYDPHDPYGNGYNRAGRDRNGSDDWKNKYQRGEKDGADDAANKKVREEKPLGPGEIWGVLGEDDGQRSGDKWGPLWVYEKTLDSLKNAEDKGDLDHSSDEEE